MCFLSYLFVRTPFWPASTGPIDKNEEAVIKRILKAKFVREEYDKMKELNQKEKNAKKMQREKRQEQHNRKRKRMVPLPNPQL